LRRCHKEVAPKARLAMVHGGEAERRSGGVDFVPWAGLSSLALG
jgi:hypothetical protein